MREGLFSGVPVTRASTRSRWIDEHALSLRARHDRRIVVHACARDRSSFVESSCVGRVGPRCRVSRVAAWTANQKPTNRRRRRPATLAGHPSFAASPGRDHQARLDAIPAAGAHAASRRSGVLRCRRHDDGSLEAHDSRAVDSGTRREWREVRPSAICRGQPEPTPGNHCDGAQQRRDRHARGGAGAVTTTTTTTTTTTIATIDAPRSHAAIDWHES